MVQYLAVGWEKKINIVIYCDIYTVIYSLNMLSPHWHQCHGKLCCDSECGCLLPFLQIFKLLTVIISGILWWVTHRLPVFPCNTTSFQLFKNHLAPCNLFLNSPENVFEDRASIVKEGTKVSFVIPHTKHFSGSNCWFSSVFLMLTGADWSLEVIWLQHCSSDKSKAVVDLKIFYTVER